MSRDLLLPTYDGACITNVVPALLQPPDHAPAWLPAAAYDAEQVVLLVVDGLGWTQLADAHGAHAHAGRPGGRADHHGGPVDHGHGAHVDHHRAAARPARRGRLPDGGRRRGAQRPALEHGHRRRPPEHPAVEDPDAALLRRPAPAGGHPRRVRHLRVHGRPPRPDPLHRVPHARHPRRRGGAPGRRPASRSSTPTTRASTRCPTSTASGAPYDEELRWIDRLVATLLEALPPGAVLLVTADHGQVEVGDHVLELPGDVLTARRPPVGGGAVPLAPRPLRPGPGPARGGHRAPRAARLGAQPGRGLAEGWFGPIVTEAAERRLGDVLLAARGDVAFHDPDDTGPYQLVGRHGSLTEAEMLVPLLAGVRWLGTGSVAAMSDHRPRQDPAPVLVPSVVADGRGAAGVGRVARQGDADRLDDQAAPRGGAGRRPRRAQPGAAPRDLRDLGHRAERGAVARPARRAGPAHPPLRGCRAARRRPSCGWPRPSWWAGSRACSTASRPPCSPSRWPPASSSSRCSASCRRAPAQPSRARRGRPARHVPVR